MCPLRIPSKLDTYSTANWTLNPEQTGQSERSDAGLEGFTLSMLAGSSFQFFEDGAVDQSELIDFEFQA